MSGLAVHIAAWVMAQARPGEIVVSGTVKDLVVGSGIDFEDCGIARAQGRARGVAIVLGSATLTRSR